MASFSFVLTRTKLKHKVEGKKVLLIDADAQTNLTMALGYNRPDDIPITLSTVMQNIIDGKSFDVSQGIIHHGEGVEHWQGIHL